MPWLTLPPRRVHKRDTPADPSSNTGAGVARLLALADAAAPVLARAVRRKMGLPAGDEEI